MIDKWDNCPPDFMHYARIFCSMVSWQLINIKVPAAKYGQNDERCKMGNIILILAKLFEYTSSIKYDELIYNTCYIQFLYTWKP